MTEGKALPGILAEIVAGNLAGLEELRARARELEKASSQAPPCRSFVRALRRPGSVALIAECKRSSPGAGPIRPGLDPARLASAYASGGAACLSVLTDSEFFGGSAADLRAARSAVGLPVLRKDFTLDPLHLLEARAMGADAVLLIVRILPEPQLADLFREATDLGMDVLVEVHDDRELDRALELGAGLVGINNRDLSSFTTSLDTTLALVDRVPDDVTLVSESGIAGADDVAVLGRHGVDAVLVGESLLRARDPAEAAMAMSGIPIQERRTGRADGRPRPNTAGAVALKVCGLQRRQDALLAERLGASFAGVILSDGYARSVEPDEAARILTGTSLKRVAVVVDEPAEEVARRASRLGADVVQLHGEEDPAEFAALARKDGWTLWKGVRADSPSRLQVAVERYGGIVDGFVVEGRLEGVAGGGGATLGLDPGELREILPPDATFVLAGGLAPDSVAQRAEVFAPDVVDVSSGIERAPGGKDAGLLREFAGRLFADHASVTIHNSLLLR